MKRTLIASALITLTACATPEPAIQVRTVEVPVIEQVPCPAEVPTRPDPLGELPADANAALAKALSVLALWSGPGMFGDRAESYFAVCASLPDSE